MAEQKPETKHTEFEKGSLLFKQGSRGGELFFIKEGEVELIVRDTESMTERVVAQVGENSVLGTMTFLEGEARSATARCLTAVKAIVVGQIQREKLLTQVPLWFKVLLKDLSSNLRNLNEEYVRNASKNEVLEKRIALMKSRFKELSSTGSAVTASDIAAMGLDSEDSKAENSKTEKTPIEAAKSVVPDLDEDHGDT